MSAPEEEDERRSPFEPPPWWDGPITLLASTGAAFVGVFLAVAVLLMTMLMAMGRLSIQWLPAVVAALGGSAI